MYIVRRAAKILTKEQLDERVSKLSINYSDQSLELLSMNSDTKSSIEKKYLTEAHRTQTEKAIAYLSTLNPQDYTWEDILAQQRRNSADKQYVL